MMYGWAGQRLKVYLTEGKIAKEPMPEDLRLNFMGGRGINSKTLYDELKLDADPLGPDNILVVGTGPLNGTAAPSTSRWTVSCKSTVYEGLGDGNGGGDFSVELKYAGYDQVIVYGKSPKPVYLMIQDGKVELRDATHLWGKTTKETHYTLLDELKDRETRVMCIGPAGENLVRVAKVFSNITRTGGKGGMGAVMGSKNLKAIAVRGTGTIKIARPDEFLKVVKRCYEKLKDSQFLKMFGEKGTMFLIRQYAELNSLPTNNAQSGHFEGWENITSEAFEAQYAVKHKGCFACPIACGHYYQVSEGPYATHGESNEYGTTYPLGPKCGIDNLAALLKMTSICDDLGLDTHSTGNTIAFAMECWQRGLITVKDTDGIDLTWGNADGVIELLPRIAYRQGFGKLLSEGSHIASQQIKGSEICLRTTKGVEVSALYPGNTNNVQSIGYATSTRGADHLRGGVLLYSWGLPQMKEALGSDEAVERLLKEPRSPEGKGMFLALDQDFSALQDSLEMCCFITGKMRKGLSPDDIAELYSAATGVDVTGRDLMQIGERIFNVEKALNIRMGFKRADDTLPPIFFEVKETEYGPTGISKTNFNRMIDDYYAYRGWDERGFPTRKKLEELGLANVSEVIGAK
ncbi:aldehyde ferredoxin oxidoreductase family protein [Chloroflexota bacterium]